VVGENPFFETGLRIRGHEFHYSKVLSWDGGSEQLVFKLKKGTGLFKKWDGICMKNILAAYTHIHALGTPQWAAGMVRAARNYRDSERPVYSGRHAQHELPQQLLK
jgi:cobyrinic acid a,c-diamide synthase